MLFERTERTERTACLRLCCTNVENLFHRCCVHATFSSLSISLLLRTAIMGVFLRRYTSYTNTDYAHIYIINAYIRLAWIILFRMQRVRVQCAMFAPDPAQYCSYVADYGFWPFFFFCLRKMLSNTISFSYVFCLYFSLLKFCTQYILDCVGARSTALFDRIDHMPFNKSVQIYKCWNQTGRERHRQRESVYTYWWCYPF